MSAQVIALAPFRYPRLDGLTVQVRAERIELDGLAAIALGEALYWAHAYGQPARVAGMVVRETRAGVELELPNGVRGTLPRKLVLTWVEVLRERALADRRSAS